MSDRYSAAAQRRKKRAALMYSRKKIPRGWRLLRVVGLRIAYAYGTRPGRGEVATFTTGFPLMKEWMRSRRAE